MIRRYSQIKKAFSEETRKVHLKDPSGKEYRIFVNVTFTKDPNYGADADGNRGVETTFVEDFTYEPEEVLVTLPNNELRYLSEFPEEERKKMKKFLDENIEENL